MKFWHRLISWLKGVFRGNSDQSERFKRRAYQELEQQQKKINAYKDGLAALIARQQKMIAGIRKQSQEVERLENLKHTSAISTRDLVKSLKAEGVAPEQIREDARYGKNLQGFQQLVVEAKRLKDAIEGLEDQVRELGPSIEQHKSLIRELIDRQQTVQGEIKRAVSEIHDAKAEQALYEQMSVSTLEVEAEPAALKELQDLRDQARAEARVARDSVEIRSALEALEATGTGGNDVLEFDALVGLSE